MKTLFEEALDFTLKWEGGYSDHPNDPGGATNRGITLGTAKAHNVDVDGDGDTDKDDIRNLPLETAMHIYKVDYWDASGCVDWSWDTAIVLFDSAVNCGPGRAKRWVQTCGDDAYKLIEMRNAYYLELAKQPRFKVFLKGWLNRTNDLKKYIDILRQKRGE